MTKSQKNFKPPPKKFQPRGITVLYEDRDILVVSKLPGLLVVSTDTVKENTVHFLLNKYVKKGNPKSTNRIYIVHRLDKDTSGILIFAKNQDAKQFLQDQWPEFTKKYFAVVHGKLEEKEGVITSYLTENSIHKVYSVTDPKKGKLATTAYKVLKDSRFFTLLEVDLITGRKNQIRVHFSDQGNAVAGDTKYGKKETGTAIKRLALHAGSITIKHPFSKEEMTFSTRVPTYFQKLLSR